MALCRVSNVWILPGDLGVCMVHGIATPFKLLSARSLKCLVHVFKFFPGPVLHRHVVEIIWDKKSECALFRPFCVSTSLCLLLIKPPKVKDPQRKYACTEASRSEMTLGDVTVA